MPLYITGLESAKSESENESVEAAQGCLLIAPNL